MSLKVHHLNLCTMCPFGGRLVSGGQTSILGRGEIVTHVLLVETPRDGLVLVDTGMGLDDVKRPVGRLGAPFVAFARPQLKEEETAIRQVERLGFRAGDVRHVVTTHLDVDHAGGIPDFPEASVHVHRVEQEAALRPPTVAERHRYRRVHFANAPRWVPHDEGGDTWEGLAGIRVVADDVVLVPLPGHSRGHSAVAVRVDERGGPEWLLHCGDAYFFHLEKEDPACCPPVLARFQATVAVDDALRRANADRVRQLHRDRGRKIRLFCAHDPTEYRSLAV